MTEPTGQVDGADRERRSSGWGAVPMRYPNAYVWFVLVSAMDVMLTWAILTADGTEVNPIAAAVIARWGLNGAIGFKFGLTLFVIVACDIVGRSRDRTGRLLARAAIVVSSIPVAWSLALLAVHIAAMPP